MIFDVEQAVAMASTAHRGQKRWNGEPYICHPLRVMLKMKSDTFKIIAVLHDTLEDTSLTVEDLHARGCGAAEISGIVSLTKKKGQSYQDFIKQIADNPLAIPPKIGDLEDNLNLADLLSPVQERDLKRIGKYLDALSFLRGLQK